QVSKRLDLARDEILPGYLFILGHRQGFGQMLRLVRDVLIDARNLPEIAEVPVESRSALLHARGDGRHHYVAAVARIARDDKLPRRSCRLPGGGGRVSTSLCRRRGGRYAEELKHQKNRSQQVLPFHLSYRSSKAAARLGAGAKTERPIVPRGWYVRNTNARVRQAADGPVWKELPAEVHSWHPAECRASPSAVRI